MNEHKTATPANKHINKFFWKAPNPMAITKARDGTYIEVNEAFVNSTGLKKQEIIGQTSVGLGYITAEQRLFLGNEIKENGYAQNIELEVKIKNNETRLGLFNSSPVKTGNDALWLTVVNDISSRRPALNALQDDILFKSFAAIEGIGVIIIRGPQQNINSLFINDEARRALDKRSLQDLFNEINGRESAYFSTATGCYHIKSISSCHGSSLKIILLERMSHLIFIKEKLKEYELTTRQQEIALLAAIGHSNNEIAKILFISEYTVKDHLKEIFQRIAICKRSELCPRILEMR
ncbi:MAG: PAS and helix-turn-helix domain-containing protein [Smithella sp.]|jgi:PAS domain S-box-containing protein|nr:PAS and helix-turn-helix domain-containing protein [Smithella sp.]